MSNLSSHIRFTVAASKRQAQMNPKRVFGLLVLALLLGASPVWADGPDDEYLQIRSVIQQADELSTGGKTAPAKAKYQEAKVALASFQHNYPDWNVKLVAYRLNNVTQKIAALSEKPPAAAGGDTASAEQTSMTQVKLLEPGAEPRKVLRLHPAPGDKQTLDVTMKLAMETKMGEVETPAVKIPPIKMTMDLTVKDVSDKGEITYEIVMGDTSVSDEPGVMPQFGETFKAAAAGLKGMSATGTMSTRGLSSGLEFKAPAGSDPQARQFMDQMKGSFAQMAVPLPEEAVGPGAKWEVKLPIKAQGMTIDQTATYEVVSLEGENVTTKTTIIQQAANQKVQNPAMPALKMDLIKMTGKGTGERTIDLAKLLPIAGTAGVHSETSMAMNMGGQKQAMNMKMDVNLRFEAR